MKGNVKQLVRLVDSYIADIKVELTNLRIEGMAIGALSVIKEAEFLRIQRKLEYVRYERDKALFIEVDFVDTEKSLGEQYER